MATIYHVNHACECRPGEVFSLHPIAVPPDNEYAADFLGWQEAFPDGLSLFGYRHLVPGYGEPPSEEKLRLEMLCERVRQQYFVDKRSRFQSFFGLGSVQEAIQFRDGIRANRGRGGSIWEVEAERIHHRGDMRWLAPQTCNAAHARAYWQGEAVDDGGNPIWECLVVPPVTMIRCVAVAE